MPHYIYKYEFNNGGIYIGADATTPFKRAVDHLAEALYVMNPEEYSRYYTVFAQKAGDLFSDFGPRNVQQMSFY